jgi:hypothetical protein
MEKKKAKGGRRLPLFSHSGVPDQSLSGDFACSDEAFELSVVNWTAGSVVSGVIPLHSFLKMG